MINIHGTVGTAPKIERNADCPCGSGIKTKHCHLRPTLPDGVPVLLGGVARSCITETAGGVRAIMFDAGAGDAIHAMRFTRELAKAEPTIFIVRPAMAQLFGMSFPELRTYTHTPLPPIARQYGSLDLIAMARGGQRAPYLYAATARPLRGRWGLCLRGDRTQAFDPWRSIHDESVVQPLLRAHPTRLERTGDWRETANIIAECQFVVSVDTGVAHLAGALGVPLVLLDRAPDPLGRDPGPDDRWDADYLQRGPLYRGGVLRLRQRERGVWSDVVEAATREVVRRLGSY